MSLIKTSFFRKNTEIIIISIAGIFFNALSLFLVGHKSGIITFISLNKNRWDFFYLVYFISAIILLGTILFYQDKFGWKKLFSIAIAVFAPSQVLYLIAIEKQLEINQYFLIMTVLYFSMLMVFLLRQNNCFPKKKNTAEKKEKKSWQTTFIIILVLSIHLYFGIHNIGKMALVDEPLWTFDRVPNFWRDVGERDWRNTRVSDKPGLTTAVISGTGLLLESNPKQYKNIKFNGEIFNLNVDKMERFNAVFRLPIFIFEALLLPFFYFFLKKLFNRKVALFSFAFIALSPILLGNSRIINPDSTLWLFTSFSLLSYLIYLKEASKKYLFFAAFFLALGLLTKYVANFLFIFFFLLIFLEYIFNPKKYKPVAFPKYIKKALVDYGYLVIFSLLFFYVLYPACWGKPSRVLIGTVYSQAFADIWQYFAGIILLVAADVFFLKARILATLVIFFTKHATFFYKLILAFFAFSVLLVWLNAATGMDMFDAEKILASPKSSASVTSLWHIYLVNFYPLIFGISPIALFAIIAFILKDLFTKNRSAFSFAAAILLLFIVLFYSGSVFSHVSLIVRYQIIIYPFVFILAGIATAELLAAKTISKYLQNLTAVNFVLIAMLFFSLANSSPFFMGYASGLLPKKYSIDRKGMGEGSYEAAQYLNSLPKAGQLTVWSDKQGVCTFFVGKCYSSLSRKFFEQTKVDYFVASSDRASRTTKMIAVKMADIADINALYAEPGISEKIILIDGRLSNFVKIVSGDKINK